VNQNFDDQTRLAIIALYEITAAMEGIELLLNSVLKARILMNEIVESDCINMINRANLLFFSPLTNSSDFSESSGLREQMRQLLDKRAKFFNDASTGRKERGYEN
jgi:hypothetical protein